MAIIGSFTAAGAASAPYCPKTASGSESAAYNITIGAFSGLAVVQRSFDGGATWHAKWPGEVYEMTGARSFVDEEPETGVLVRLLCTALTSGTPAYRIGA